MKKEIKYIITDEDYELLRNIVIVNPCEECGDGFGGCCGCEKERQY